MKVRMDVRVFSFPFVFRLILPWLFIQRDARTCTKDGQIALRDLITKDVATGLDVLPHWLAQPYFRPLLEKR